MVCDQYKRLESCTQMKPNQKNEHTRNTGKRKKILIQPLWNFWEISTTIVFRAFLGRIL